QRYIYRGYLQIACIDLTRSHHPALWLITWDPSQPVATRPLAIQKNGTWYTYGLDLTKNVCEVFGSSGYIGTAYTYTPYGDVTSTGNVDQPIQWSSEFNDSELGLVYYNYRYYNACNGRWLSKDPLGEYTGENLYSMVMNSLMDTIDLLGLNAVIVSGGINTDLDRDRDHDKNWRNYITSAKMRFEEISENCGSNKEWIVNEPSYIKRAEYDMSKYSLNPNAIAKTIVPEWIPVEGKVFLKNAYLFVSELIIPDNYVPVYNNKSYIDTIKRIAKTIGVNLRWYKSRQEFLNILHTQSNGKARIGNSKIGYFAYFGHGYIGKLAIIFDKEEINREYIFASDFSLKDFKYLSYIDLSTCHSASRPVDNPRQQSIAQEISKQLYARVLGYDGRASYYDVAKNGHVKVGESISRAAVVESHRLTKKKDNDSSYGYSVRKRMFVNGVEPRGLNFILGSM
ncbi:MAG: RHS repeat-associated core domain-containing protein, partial [Akkermansia sp.]|nr:RHS repeat-associated core domain-containing protein [Akkermansia sp.]